MVASRRTAVRWLGCVHIQIKGGAMKKGYRLAGAALGLALVTVLLAGPAFGAGLRTVLIESFTNTG
jgi:hypothetical protein